MTSILQKLNRGLNRVPRVSIRDYFIITKPIVVALLLVTTLTAMIVGYGGWPDLFLVGWTMLGGALCAGGASTLNQYIDREGDRLMHRTKNRPLAAGRMSEKEVVLFGVALSLVGLIVLFIFVNTLSAILALVGILYYVLLYSVLLKPITPYNIVIGGGAGAIPTLVGWAAVRGELSMEAFFLWAIVFFWTPPHFWALALLKLNDYARAGIPMFPVVHGERVTRWQIFLYTIQVVALTWLLPIVKLGSWFYLSAATILGIGFVGYAWKVFRGGGNKVTWRLYRYSSLYLAMLFAALVLDTIL